MSAPLPPTYRAVPRQQEQRPYRSFPRDGRPLLVEVIGPSIAYIPLQRGIYSLIDSDQSSNLSAFVWSLDTTGYVVTRGEKGRAKRMHRVVAETPEDMLTDHRNGNRLDNRRANLRPCTPTQNLRNVGSRRNNTSGAKGVYLHRSSGKYQARIKVNGTVHSLGAYWKLEEAAEAYARAAKEFHGEFANVGPQIAAAKAGAR